MNYGRFFKLNQDLSTVVNGVTVFDYTELPAHERLASDVYMSPKYPISMSITANAVRFKMHYCVYRCSIIKKNKVNEGSDTIIYGFSIDDIMRQLHGSYCNQSFENDRLDVVHMEEVVLELPFSGIEAKSLTDIIKKTYFATFPQVAEMEEREKINDLSHTKVTGNQFLNKLIRNRFPKEDKNHIPVSYSTLWLMDLYQGNSINLCSGRNNHKLIDKFLRKLLLDFMFDLKHSNVFQTSANYDKMYSGLMSDYYFSALMHKCEYYYYRELSTQAIKAFEEKRRNNQLGEHSEKRIIYLYAKELFDAEERWANDIRNPLSDRFFERKFPDDFKSRWGRLKTEICSVFGERMTTTHWDSWFASPEEEMRRIYFPYKTHNNNTDVCNSVSLTEFLHLNFKDKQNNNSSIKKDLADLANESRGKSSRWFLNRFDYNDALRLHTFKHSNLLFMLMALILIGLIALPYFQLTKWESLGIISIVKFITTIPGMLLLLALPFLIIGGLLFLPQEKGIKNDPFNPLVQIYNSLTFNKLWLSTNIFLFFLFIFLLIIINNRGVAQNNLAQLFSVEHIICYIALIVLFFLFVYNYLITHGIILRHTFLFSASFHPIKSWHMFLPKLTASITAAWLALTNGYDKYVNYLQSNISGYVLIVIVLVVIVFFMYVVDHACLSSSSWVKVFRSFEHLVICFFISLTIGAIFMLLKKEEQLDINKILDNWFNLSLIAMFTGLFLTMIFKSGNQMTDI